MKNPFLERLQISGLVAMFLFFLLVAIKPQMLVPEEGEAALAYHYEILPFVGYLLLSGMICGILLWKGDIKNRLLANSAAIISLLFMPGISFFIFETVAENFLTIIGNQAGLVILNLCIWYLLYAVVFALSNHARFTIIFVNTAAYLLAVANAFVVQFREQPIMVMDLKSIRTAASVAGNFQYTSTVNMVLMGLLTVLCDLWVMKLDVKLPGWKSRLSYTVATACCVGYCFYGMLAGDFLSRAGSRGLDFFRFNYTYQTNGYMACTVESLRYLRAKAPEGYSVETVKEIAANIGEESCVSAQPALDLPENVIVIMNESFADLSVLGEFQTSEPVLPHLEDMKENTIHGYTYVSAFGGGTANSEFEFLTGNSAAFIPSGSIAYQMYVKEGDSSLVSLLKENGYKTIVYHPYRKDNYNRPAVYDIYGFDEYYGKGDIKYKKLRKYASDISDYKGIIRLYEGKEPGEKLFLFNITMQNHSGYAEPNYENTISLTDYPGEFPQAEQYLSLIHESDRAFYKLTQYFSKVEENTVILLFGDHQPRLEDAFYERIMEPETAENVLSNAQKKAMTPYVLWANYGLNIEQAEHISTNYLGSYLLDAIGIELPVYNRFLLEMREKVPVLNMGGFMDENGGLHWHGEESVYQDLIRQYHMLEYNNLFDRRNRVKEIFG